MSWYVAMAKNGRALKAYDELTESGFCVVFPMWREYRRDHLGVRRLEERPALGRYLIIDAEEGDLPDIKAAWNVDAMLKDETGPIVLPPAEVDNVIELDGSGILDRTSGYGRKLSKDDMVRLTKGLFEGVIGKLVKQRGHGKWEIEIATTFGRGAGKMVAGEGEVELMDGEKAA